MAVFRVEKTRDYTVMANHHLRNTALSLKTVQQAPTIDLVGLMEQLQKSPELASALTVLIATTAARK